MSLLAQRFETPFGPLNIAATATGICRIAFPVELSGSWLPWFDRHFGCLPNRDSSPLLVEAAWQLSQYFRGLRTEFTVPVELRGTDFQQTVWRRLQEIPFGRTVSYSELARLLGVPRGARAIGAANACNPVPILVPCHRVIGSGGGLVGFGGGIELKERLLELERSRIPFGSWQEIEGLPLACESA